MKRSCHCGRRDWNRAQSAFAGSAIVLILSRSLSSVYLLSTETGVVVPCFPTSPSQPCELPRQCPLTTPCSETLRPGAGTARMVICLAEGDACHIGCLSSIENLGNCLQAQALGRHLSCCVGLYNCVEPQNLSQLVLNRICSKGGVNCVG